MHRIYWVSTYGLASPTLEELSILEIGSVSQIAILVKISLHCIRSLTNFIEQNSSWEAASSAAVQGFPNILWNSKVY
jgi:hypothetical protein